MNVEETAKVLSYVKAAYPSSFKDMRKEDMSRVLSLWQMKFKEIPADLVLMAVDRLVGEVKFAPTIAEVSEKLNDIYWENFMNKWAVDRGTLHLPEPETQRIYHIHNSLCGFTGDLITASTIGNGEKKLLKE